MSENIESYEVELENKVQDFRKKEFWNFETGPAAAREKMNEAEARQNEEKKILEKNAHLCRIFEFPDKIKVGGKKS